MIDEDKFREILQRLLEKSRGNKVRWRQSTSDEGGELYAVFFPRNAQVDIYYNSPPSAPDCIRATLFVGKRLAISMDAEDGDSPDWKLLESVVQDARRCVFGFDEALEAIDQALASDDPIGPLPEAPSGDDIPF